jgi:hypothetical protein
MCTRWRRSTVSVALNRVGNLSDLVLLVLVQMLMERTHMRCGLNSRRMQGCIRRRAKARRHDDPPPVLLLHAAIIAVVGSTVRGVRFVAWKGVKAHRRRVTRYFEKILRRVSITFSVTRPV